MNAGKTATLILMKMNKQFLLDRIVLVVFSAVIFIFFLFSGFAGISYFNEASASNGMDATTRNSLSHK